MLGADGAIISTWQTFPVSTDKKNAAQHPPYISPYLHGSEFPHDKDGRLHVFDCQTKCCKFCLKIDSIDFGFVFLRTRYGLVSVSYVQTHTPRGKNTTNNRRTNSNRPPPNHVYTVLYCSPFVKRASVDRTHSRNPSV